MPRFRPLATILALVGSGPASAAPITFHFEGTVSVVFDDGSLLDGSVTAGSPFSGSYTFDSDAPNISTDPLEGKYVFPSPNGIQVGVGNYVFHTDPVGSLFTITVGNFPSGDRYRVSNGFSESEGPEFPGFLNSISIRWQLGGPSDLLSSVELLTEPPDLEAWIANVFEIYGQNMICGECPVFRISSEVTGIVPEPSTGVMVLLGLLVLAVRRSQPSHG